MESLVIKVKNVSKMYRISQRDDTLRETIFEVSYEAIDKKITKLDNVNLGLAFFGQSGQFLFELVSKQANNTFSSLPAKGEDLLPNTSFSLNWRELLLNNVVSCRWYSGRSN